ncbi:GIY-YIG nuclease family protein [Brumimicrobium sp.]|uniref:GIY-YIG nuclease family protein n=1 Tax=Brumimicrobium sp. TaxID=2029867 RepID=UPI00345B7B10
MNQYCTYILFSPKFNKYYIGQTQNLENRISTHNSGKVKSTKHYLPWVKVLILEKNTRSEAIVLERKLKNLNRERLLEFIDRYKV